MAIAAGGDIRRMMARQLGCPPKEVIIYGVQPAVIRPPGLELSPEVAEVVPKVIKAVLEGGYEVK